MPLISVIMPSYNVKNYIAECMDSVCGQTFEDLEILCIDAGSEDGTLEILRAYEQQDSRVKVHLSEQKSYGYQVNKGIQLAQGKYIAVVETDDIIEKNMFELLFAEAQAHNLDYVKGQFARLIAFEDGTVWKQKMRVYPLSLELFGRVLTPSEDAMAYLKDIYLWTGIYNREFLLTNGICLNETKGAAFLDQGFLFQTISCAKRAMYISDVVYHYRQNNAGSSVFNPKGFQYLVGEYPFVKAQCEAKRIPEKTYLMPYYTRMFMQTVARYATMAASGRLWENTVEPRGQLGKWIQEADTQGMFDEELLDKTVWMELQQYLEDEESYWQYQLSRYHAKRRSLRELFRKAREAGEVVFYSKSIVGGFVYCLLKTAGIDVPVCFCDNDEKKQGTTYMNAPVLSV